MNLQQLRFVRETAQHGFSLTRAAQAIGTSQPALSRGILELEAELGVSLFKRQGRGLGRALLTHAIARLREEGHPTVTLQAPRENARALALFSSVGFRHDATYSTLTCTL